MVERGLSANCWTQSLTQKTGISELEARVQPRAKRNSVEVLPGLKLGVCVTAPPEGGRANHAVITLLAKRLGVAKSSIAILRGVQSRNKLIRVNGLSPEEVFTRLATG